AGDVCTARVLDELAGYAPVLAVKGNNDGRDVAAWGAPDRLETSIEGLRVAMVHDSGPAAGRPARLRRWFPGAALVVFGHSHIPIDHAENGQRIFNPRSPTHPPPPPARPPGLPDNAHGRLSHAPALP